MPRSKADFLGAIQGHLTDMRNKARGLPSGDPASPSSSEYWMNQIVSLNAASSKARDADAMRKLLGTVIQRRDTLNAKVGQRENLARLQQADASLRGFRQGRAAPGSSAGIGRALGARPKNEGEWTADDIEADARELRKEVERAQFGVDAAGEMLDEALELGEEEEGEANEIERMAMDEARLKREGSVHGGQGFESDSSVGGESDNPAQDTQSESDDSELGIELALLSESPEGSEPKPFEIESQRAEKNPTPWWATPRGAGMLFIAEAAGAGALGGGMSALAHGEAAKIGVGVGLSFGLFLLLAFVTASAISQQNNPPQKATTEDDVQEAVDVANEVMEQHSQLGHSE